MVLKTAEIISGGISLGIAIFIFTTTRKFPSLPGGIPGPALFPYILSCMLGFFSVILICSGLFPSRELAGQTKTLERGCGDLQAKQPQPLESGSQDVGEVLAAPLSKWEGFINMVLVILGMIFFVLFVKEVGFILIALLLCVGLMLRLGVSPIKAVCISTGTVMVIFWLFAKLMLVPLPSGVIGL
jgi:hypothetical protein